MIYVVLPAYNEEVSLAALLSRIKTALDGFPGGYEVAVVNDGSRDKTLAVAQRFSKEMPVTVLDHVQNKGLGAALRTGLTYAGNKAQADDVIITMDADNTHSPDLIGGMVAQSRRGFGLVVASRYVPGAQEIGLSFYRRVLSLCAGLVLRTFFPIVGVRDYTCGYRAYRAVTLKKAIEIYGDAFVQERGFTSIVEILLKLRQMGVTASEVPLVLRYDLKGGKSKMPVTKTILRYWTIISQNVLRPGTRPFRHIVSK